ncbi:DEAD/DEAH box helicase [Halomonas litopenaei]|uniref:DEAD/DEAH box helicase n=1 Tax=Halomonas litopenaei TaxID=2109328 RepID=A0ABX5IYQ5_9GAMM|nr:MULTISPECIES: DEAD/DEAH box helicase [Halomonas]PTL93695.1 DEAD/DEAH box helicase [Halomonas sp. SYSU XM8]PTL95732.1 DEAD/DEAH box helicase [Halomonas litopenaei]
MSEAASSSYSLLDPHIQRWIWRQQWEHLRDVQEQAIPVVLAGEQDVLIGAATASGKTEAAFFPALTGLLQARDAGQAPAPLLLYVAPLKALINDQFGRLELLTEGTDLALTPWHGDVSASRKTRFGKTPGGVLLITPESLEALFVRRGTEIARLFGGLRQIIIDEWHAFIGTERGVQLQSQMNRLEVVLQRRIPRVGLSATLGDMSLAANELRPGEGEAVIPIVSTHDEQALHVQLRGYERLPPKTSAKEAEALSRQGKDVPIEDVTHGDELVIRDHLFRHLRGQSNLIFANRKRDVELYAELLRRKSQEQRLPEEFFVHHGSLSRDLRHHVEQSLKVGKPLSVVCTSTLEMGVDIGSVASIAQIGPPHQVASLRQRLGRSGRRGDPAVLRLYVTESSLSPHTPFLDRLRPGVYQAAAMVELLVEGWCEPPPSGYLHLSTLIQQVMSLIAQYGGASAGDLWRSLIKSGPFRQLSQAQFTALLRAMGTHELLVQSTDGLLLHGPVGERLVNHYGFYAAFSAPEEYTLYHGAKIIGKLPIDSPIETGGLLVFAGRRWLIQDIDADRKAISLVPSAGGILPLFGGNAGLIRREIRERMRTLYIEGLTPSFLNRGAARLFAQGGAFFRDAQLETTPIVQEADQTLLLPWQSDQVLNTLALLLRRCGLTAEREGIAVTVQKSDSDMVRRGLEHAVAHPPTSAVELATVAENKINEKYDEYLPEELLCSEFASRFLDLEGALQTAGTLLDRP